MASRITSHAVRVALVSLTLTAGTATAAHADAFRHRDATGDVIMSKYGKTLGVDSTRRRPDIQQFTVLHGRWMLSIATSMRGFDAIDNDWTATIVTSKGDRFEAYRAVSSGDDSSPFHGVLRNGYRFRCDGITISRTASGVIAKIPTRCLGNPWKVRVGVQADATYVEDEDFDGHDDALRTGGYTDRKPALSPWIAR